MRGFTLAGVFCLWMTLTNGVNIEMIPPRPMVNHSVLLSVTQLSGSVWSFSWFRGERARSQNQILAYNTRNDPSETAGPLYAPRFSAFPNASLGISNLYTEDQGNYIVQVVTSNGQERSAVQLLAYALVFKPVIRTSSLYPIANDTISLTCDTMNSEKIHWGRSGKMFPPGVITSSNNRTITFPTIKPLDAGLYWCEAENLVSRRTSDVYTLNVYCICGSSSELSAGELSGIIIGTLLGILLVGGILLLLLFLKRCKPPEGEEPREDATKKQSPPTEYYNVQAVTGPDASCPDSAYTDLQYSSQDVYCDLRN
ncbi:carcinoembryonic antigen-related cell adhesion molecule 7-like [Bufo bufo]|uniref:carcinoembryonic antigen-related cell adhesion molecule 7-like n=1 Tax=Bufo bufo TaxID=8384 RepID=UPI001ABE90FD|nr:carcinoembryonic antigen-related cell adhesion molecule 7-like [Bufo bufo]